MPAGKTYVKIASQTLASTSSTVTFSNLPQNFTDLVMVINGRTSADGIYLNLRLNNDTTSTLSATRLLGNGSASSSSRATAQNLLSLTPNVAWDTTNSGTLIIQIQNYSNASIYKSMIIRGNIERPGTAGEVSAIVGLWASTAAVNRIDIITGSSTIAAGSTFTIYGIAASKAPQATGGTITTDGTYWIHTFTSSGLFIPQQSINSVDYLVVAGGGGGGGCSSYGDSSGGAGAGGLRTNVGGTALSLAFNTSYTVTVGAGGSGGSAGNNPGNKGSNSVFSTISATGGGFSAQANGASGNGGSGGGQGGNVSGSAGTGNEGGYSPAEGNNGGSRSGETPGGGGGASAAGVSGASGGAGGAGSASSITGTSVTYAGGGGAGKYATSGASGGAGGGGNGGGNAVNGSSGTANTGGGGGGTGSGNSGGAAAGGNGGSGIVIVRYPI